MLKKTLSLTIALLGASFAAEHSAHSSEGNVVIPAETAPAADHHDASAPVEHKNREAGVDHAKAEKGDHKKKKKAKKAHSAKKHHGHKKHRHRHHAKSHCQDNKITDELNAMAASGARAQATIAQAPVDMGHQSVVDTQANIKDAQKEVAEIKAAIN
jgi:hypothetical protein